MARIYPETTNEPTNIEFIPNEGQKQIFKTTKRFIFAMSGQRGGKTTVGAYWAGLNSQIPKTTGLIAANTMDQLNQSTLSKFWEIFPMLKKHYVLRDRTIYVPNGSRIFTRSLDDPDLLKGLNLNWEWIDEGDGITRYAWDVLRSRVATTLGKILITSSIYVSGWINDEIFLPSEKHKDDPDWPYLIVSWPSIDNPSFPQSEWDELKATTDPIHFEREYGGKFVFNTGKVYGGIEKYGFLKENKYLGDSKPIRLLFGIDFGVNDPTAISAVTLNDDGNWYVIDEVYAPSMDIQEINKHLESFITRHGIPMLTIIDPAGGVARISLNPRCNPYDAVQAKRNIDPGITLMRDLIFQEKVYVFPRCVNTIREFKLYQYNPKKPREPEDRNNHILDELRYIFYTTYDWLKGLAKKPQDEIELPLFWQRKLARGEPTLSSDERFSQQFGQIE